MSYKDISSFYHQSLHSTKILYPSKTLYPTKTLFYKNLISSKDTDIIFL